MAWKTTFDGKALFKFQDLLKTFVDLKKSLYIRVVWACKQSQKYNVNFLFPTACSPTNIGNIWQIFIFKNVAILQNF